MPLSDLRPKNLGPFDADAAGMFELAPTSLWLEDYQDLRTQLDIWRQEGVRDLKAFLLEDFSRVSACTAKIKVLKVNESVEKIIDLNNKLYSEAALSLSMAMATSLPGERLEAVVRRADGRMYREKGAFYAGKEDRRQAS